MTTNFDDEIDRSGTGSVKWEYLQDPDNPLKKIKTDSCYGENRILPMWVADMDFRCPEPVVKALEKRARHGIFGYTREDEAYLKVVVDWMRKQHDWDVKTEWIVTTPGIVPAIYMLVQTFTEPGDKVLVQQPAYYPFFSAIESNGCRIVSNSLVLKEGRYYMDIQDLEQKAADPDVKLAILCSPHNPVGRVWTPEELHSFGEICLRHHVQVIADEIHHDIVYPGNRFTPFAHVGSRIAENAVFCTAPSKTFNLAGLHTSNIIIPKKSIREKYQHTLGINGFPGINPFGLTACRVAYEEGREWLANFLDYLQGNLEAMLELFDREIPRISIIHPEGTYLVWFDCRVLNLDNRSLRHLMLNQARVFLDEGYIFGPEGGGFERINIACPRSVLMEALNRIVRAIQST